MTSSTDPDQIRRDIERTRRELSSDVDALAEKVTPSRVVERKVERARDTLTNVKEKVMGTATDATHAAQDMAATAVSAVSDTASSVADSVTGTASSMTGSVTHAPTTAKRKAQGNPFAAALIAFGAGWLISSLIPVTEREQQAGAALKEKAADLKEPLTEMAHEAMDQLKEPAAQAAESIKETAVEAASTVKEEATAGAGDLTEQAKHAKESVSGA
jgi:hypothetical protein